MQELLVTPPKPVWSLDDDGQVAFKMECNLQLNHGDVIGFWGKDIQFIGKSRIDGLHIFKFYTNDKDE